MGQRRLPVRCPVGLIVGGDGDAAVRIRSCGVISPTARVLIGWRVELRQRYAERSANPFGTAVIGHWRLRTALLYGVGCVL
ncbi:MAG: hypothetical protein QOJ80_7317 [Mycobacterium sp.]|jgi:hypothetical protein|nr:hypothetical protein [Mycobacterium sp.]